jgi:hypothetical protein
MSELYQNLSNRYSNSIKFIDDFDLKGIILFNEPIEQVRKMWVKYKYSKFSLVDEKEETINNPILKFAPIFKSANNIGKLPKVIGRKNITVDRSVYKIDIIEFVKYALTRGYDWKLFGKPQWEAIEPKKKKKFMKPKKRKR